MKTIVKTVRGYISTMQVGFRPDVSKMDFSQFNTLLTQRLAPEKTLEDVDEPVELVGQPAVMAMYKELLARSFVKHVTFVEVNTVAAFSWLLTKTECELLDKLRKQTIKAVGLSVEGASSAAAASSSSSTSRSGAGGGMSSGSKPGQKKGTHKMLRPWSRPCSSRVGSVCLCLRQSFQPMVGAPVCLCLSSASSL